MSDRHDVWPTDDEMPDLAPYDIGGIIWLPDGGEAAKNAMKVVYEGGDAA